MPLKILNKNTRFAAFFLVLLWLPLTLTSYQRLLSSKSSAKNLAKKHSIVYNKPAPDFFEGALLGNGGLGVVVTTRPDAIVLHFGHNNVWDIRIAEEHKSEIKNFNYVFNRLKTLPDTIGKLTNDMWYRAYHKVASDNYSQPYPRPFPCGSVVLGFDRRKAELLGHSLDISNGVCTVKLLTIDKKKVFLKIFTDMQADNLLMQLVNEEGQPAKNVFNRIEISPDETTPKEFPRFTASESLSEGELAFRQVLLSNPATVDTKQHDKDKAFALAIKVNKRLRKSERLNINGGVDRMGKLEGALSENGNFSATVSLVEGFDEQVSKERVALPKPSYQSFKNTLEKNEQVWNQYWAKSSVELSDDFLEGLWYRNLYFFNCVAKDGANCPGLFGNWSYGNIGSQWHGDYHFNYNIQQPFWMTFSSNHLEKNLPYVNLIEFLMPVSQQWAKEYYELPGAAFPHTAYPVQMTMSPYAIPDWGWQIAETPWAVQGLWWHYLYTGDTTFLKTRAYRPIKAAVEFLVGFLKRPDARGERWNDNNYHIFPTVPPEVHGLTPGFKYNYDGSIDLALTKFIFKAFQKATAILGTEGDEKELLMQIADILQNYPEYPTAKSGEFGEVFVAAPGEHGDVVYNVPISLSPVFPGEDRDVLDNKYTFKKWLNTFKNMQNEGGNDLVFANMQAARLRVLDLEQFKRQVNYCLLPNSTATNLVLQTNGRYNDRSNFRFMANSGIWFENFALPAVINECLMQGYNETITLFPNWPKEKDARFTDLRAAGAFLVSANQQAGEVTEVKILSEKGNKLQLKVPWGANGVVITNAGKKKITNDLLVLETIPGQVIILRPH